MISRDHRPNAWAGYPAWTADAKSDRQTQSDIGCHFLNLFQSRTKIKQCPVLTCRVSELTGSSSFPFQIPATCLCIMTCLMFSKAGMAVQPAFMHVVSGLFTVIPSNVHASFVKVSYISTHNSESNRHLYGELPMPFGTNSSIPIKDWISERRYI